MNDAVRLQLAQLLGEHFLGDSRDEPAQLGEAVGALMQPPQDQGLPFPTNNVDRRFYRAIVNFSLHSSSDYLFA
jgi:hypothetical protein